jgi:SAM-dependent methyltransferase
MACACPICDAAGSRALFSRRSPFSAAQGLRYQVRECYICNHRWCIGEVSPELLGAIYRGSFHSSSQQIAADPSAPVVVNAGTRARWLAEQGLSGRLLDIGAGNGYFVRAAGETGFDAEGVELSPDAAAAARIMGANVRQGDFLSAEEAGGPYDVVTMWDVLSGMTDPHATLARVARLLRPDGHFVATVANGESAVAKLSGRFWPLMIPPVNLHFFSAESMRVLLVRHGFASDVYSHHAKRVSLRFIGQKLARTLGTGPLETLCTRTVPSTWTIRLDMGDIATVTARRGSAS